jgi:hypothetical protein
MEIIIWIAFIGFFVIKFALLGYGAYLLFGMVEGIFKAIFEPKVIIVKRRSTPKRQRNTI